MPTFEARGISGYAGYVPNSEIIPPAIKGSQVHTGKVRASDSVRGKGGLVVDAAPTETMTAFSMTADMFPTDMAARASGASSPYNPFHDGLLATPKPFVGGTTYQHEFSGASKMERVLAAGPYVGGAIRPEASGGKNVLYETEAKQKQAEALEVASVYRPHVYVGGYRPPPPEPSAAQKARLAADFASIERAASRANLDTSYRQSFGGKDFDPRTIVPLRARDLSLKASTREHFGGTAKGVGHLPGYSGFMAAAPQQRHAQEHTAAVEKGSTKRILMSNLGQFPRSVPGYLGFQPRAFVNQREPVRDLSRTAAGCADLAGSRNFVPGDPAKGVRAEATVVYEPSKVGVTNSLVSNFFKHGALAVSDNGVHNAEAYYSMLRPLEGRSVPLIKPVSQAPILTNMV